METKSKNLRDKMYTWVLAEISGAELSGVPVSVDGVVYSMEEKEQLQRVMEDTYYMKSYEEDAQGKIVQIDFAHITEV